MVGELESAIAIFERCRESAALRNDRILELQFDVLLAHALIDSGNLGRAEELLGSALAIGKNAQSPTLRAQLYWSQSRLHDERNDPETAARYARRALEILLLTEDTFRTARAHQLLAYIELNRGNAKRPSISSRRAGRSSSERQQPRAGAVPPRGGPRARQARAERGGRGTRDADLRPDLGCAARGRGAELHGAGSVYEELGDRGRARELYELAAELLEPRNPNRFLIEVYSKLADLAEAEGRKEEAYEYMKKAVGKQQAVAETAPS